MEASTYNSYLKSKIGISRRKRKIYKRHWVNKGGYERLRLLDEIGEEVVGGRGERVRKESRGGEKWWRKNGKMKKKRSEKGKEKRRKSKERLSEKVE